MTTAAVLVVSDEIAAHPEENRAGPVAVDLLCAAGLEVTMSVIGAADIDDALPLAVAQADVVVTVGGTSMRPGEHVPEATAALAAQGSFAELPGIMEETRRRGAATTLASLASRGLCGVASVGTHRCLVLNAPSSRGGVKDAVGLLVELLPHLLRDLVGGHRN